MQYLIYPLVATVEPGDKVKCTVTVRHFGPAEKRTIKAELGIFGPYLWGICAGWSWPDYQFGDDIEKVGTYTLEDVKAIYTMYPLISVCQYVDIRGRLIIEGVLETYTDVVFRFHETGP